MAYKCKLNVAAKSQELLDKEVKRLISAKVINGNAFHPLQIIEPCRYYKFKWYCCTAEIISETDLVYWEDGKWSGVLEECAKELHNDGIVYILFEDVNNGKRSSYAFSSPCGVSAGRGRMPEDFACDFEDETAEDLINLLSDLCPECYQ